MAARGHREAVRPRPRERARARRRRVGGLPARLGLPHRPLPRQGDGPEPPGPALRQPDVRAHLERELRRPRADHDGRGHRHRGPRRLLRRHRRRARRHPEPPAPAARARRDGGAGVVRRALPAGREDQGALRRAPAARAVPAHGPWAVRRRLAGRRGGHRLPRGGRHPRHLHHGDVRGGPRRHRQPPLGGRPVLPAHGQAPGASRDRGRRRVQEGPAPAVRELAGVGPREQRARDPRPAGRGRDDALRRQGPGHRDGGPRRDDGLRLRARVHGVVAGGVRAPHPRRPARRPAAVPHARGGRALLEDPRPDHRALGREGQARAVPVGHVGAGVRRRDARARRPRLAAPGPAPAAAARAARPRETPRPRRAPVRGTTLRPARTPR